MAGLFEDQLLSPTAYSPNSGEGIMDAPPVASAGLGLTPAIAPPPIVSGAPVAQMAPAATPSMPSVQPQGRPLDERLAYAAEAFGAGMKGQPSLLEREQAQARQDKLLKVKELAAHVDALESGSKIAKTLQGPAKASFVKDYAAQLDQMRPGLGGTFTHVAESPDTLDLVQQYMPYLPEATKLLMKQNPDAFWKYAASEGGQKDIENAKNQYYMSLAAKKATLVMGKLDALGLPADLVQAAKANPSASTFKSIQDALPDGNPAKLTDKQWAVINSSSHTQDTFYNALGLMSPKDEAAVRTKKAEDKGKRDTIEIGVGGDMFQKAYVQDGKVMEKIGEPYKKKEGVTINMPSSSGMGMNPDTGEQGHYTIGKDGTVRWDAVKPLPKEVDPVKKAIADAMNPGGKSLGYGTRADGTQKGNGFLGPLPTTRPGAPKDEVSTEISVGVNIGGKQVEIPTMVPTLTKAEIDYLLAGKDPRSNETIMNKAVTHAKQRIASGKSPFAAASESPRTLPTGIPQGSKLIGKTPEGKDVYKSPDGKKWVP